MPQRPLWVPCRDRGRRSGPPAPALERGDRAGPADVLEALRDRDRPANFSLIESRPFTDLCPIVHDRQVEDRSTSSPSGPGQASSGSPRARSRSILPESSIRRRPRPRSRPLALTGATRDQSRRPTPEFATTVVTTPIASSTPPTASRPRMSGPRYSGLVRHRTPGTLGRIGRVARATPSRARCRPSRPLRQSWATP